MTRIMNYFLDAADFRSRSKFSHIYRDSNLNPQTEDSCVEAEVEGYDPTSEDDLEIRVDGENMTPYLTQKAIDRVSEDYVDFIKETLQELDNEAFSDVPSESESY